jgi:hypothetical protein
VYGSDEVNAVGCGNKIKIKIRDRLPDYRGTPRRSPSSSLGNPSLEIDDRGSGVTHGSDNTRPKMSKVKESS